MKGGFVLICRCGGLGESDVKGWKLKAETD